MRGRIVRTSDLAGGGDLAVQLTRCARTWFEQPPDADEQARIAAASRQLRAQRQLALALHQDEPRLSALCIEIFRQGVFNPLHFSAKLVANIIAQVGEPPIVAASESAIFSDYLRRAVLSVASPNVRRHLAAQLRRTLPTYVEAGRWPEAVAIDHSAFRTALGNEVTPFLAQMALAGLADYYEEVESQEGA
ncbi:MAG: hypothetical protein HGA65_12890 [Oscillochloris sp.]|nr:hypothetical protein [Oscillochloris sp.]